MPVEDGIRVLQRRERRNLRDASLRETEPCPLGDEGYAADVILPLSRREAVVGMGRGVRIRGRRRAGFAKVLAERASVVHVPLEGLPRLRQRLGDVGLKEAAEDRK